VLGASLEYLRRDLSSSSFESGMETLNGLGRMVAEADGNLVKGAAMSMSRILSVDVLFLKVKMMMSLLLTKEKKRRVNRGLIR
jgi:hypothetical protein